MNPDLILKFMSQDVPWAFGLRLAIGENLEKWGSAPVAEYPFFASKGPHGGQFTAIGDDLEDCMQLCLEHKLDSYAWSTNSTAG